MDNFIVCCLVKGTVILKISPTLVSHPRIEVTTAFYVSGNNLTADRRFPF